MWRALLLVVALGSVAAAGTPKPAEVALAAPWDKLDLSSHNEAKIYKTVGAKKLSPKQSQCAETGALTDGICWQAAKLEQGWVVFLDFDSIAAARAKVLDAWGPSMDAPHKGKTRHSWFVRAGAHHFMARWDEEADAAVTITLQQIVPFSDVVAIAQKLVGKKRSELARVAGRELFRPCGPKEAKCYIDWGANEVASISLVATAIFGDGQTAQSIGLETLCDEDCGSAPARLESIFGTSDTKTCDYQGAQTTFMVFPNGLVAGYLTKDADTIHGCVGRCAVPCK
ncbi:MAG TPA: hypothetical protein VGM39_11430 [Kofleriaceae bacterium]|jgi:hypothetical protein